MAYLDPTTIRLSDSFLLSDFMGCTSVYRYGYPNRISNADENKIKEGCNLAEHLEQIQEKFGPLSVIYGYISPDLSKKIVTYQSPDKPSYHRWDAGAAADIIPHNHNTIYCRNVDNDGGNQPFAPIRFAYEVAINMEFSRMITYAESEAVCFATRLSEKGGKGRSALYENRYVGERKPNHIKHPTDKEILKARRYLDLNWPWRGQGYPSYHGGGHKQFEHYRLDDHVILSDFLYDSERVHHGKINIPWNIGSKAACCYEKSLQDATDVLELLVSRYMTRFSIVSGFHRSTEVERNWTRNFRLEVVPPDTLSILDVAHEVDKLPQVASTRIRKMKSGIHRLVITGRKHHE